MADRVVYFSCCERKPAGVASIIHGKILLSSLIILEVSLEETGEINIKDKEMLSPRKSIEREEQIFKYFDKISCAIPLRICRTSKKLKSLRFYTLGIR